MGPHHSGLYFHAFGKICRSRRGDSFYGAIYYAFSRERRTPMNRLKLFFLVVFMVSFSLFCTQGVLAKDVKGVVKKCFAELDGIALEVAADLGEMTFEEFLKNPNKGAHAVSEKLDKSWTNVAACIDAKLKPKEGSGKPENLKESIKNRSGDCWKETDGKGWWDDGYINECVFTKAVKIFESSDNLTKTKEFKKMKKKKRKAELKNIMDNQKKIMRGEVGGCMKSENKKYLKRLVKYLNTHYELK